MKWGRKQQKHSSSPAFSVTQVFPLSWISKLKQKSSKHQPQSQFKPAASPKPSTGLKSQPKSKSNLNFTPNSKPSLLSHRGSFHVTHPILERTVGPAPVNSDDGFRYLSSVGDEDVSFLDGKEKRRGWSFESARYTSAVTEPEFPSLSCRSDLGMPESRKFTDMISDIRRSRHVVPPPSEKEESEKEQSRRRHSAAPERRIKREHPSLKPIHTSDSRNSDRKEEENRRVSGARRSFSGKMRQRSRVKVYSPRKASKMDTWRVKAKKRPGQKEEEKGKRLESFAVVKCSYDPPKDFRDSMVEMILEHGIGQPEELESLLACYLSLNSDEYHDVIVKVFRQVWFHLRRVEGSYFH